MGGAGNAPDLDSRSSQGARVDSQSHPVVAAAAVLEAALKDVADLDPVFMPTTEKKAALLAMDRVASRLAELRLRVMAAADDVALEEGARDIGVWLAHHRRGDRGEARRDLRLARALDTRRQVVARALRDGEVNRAQAEVIVAAVDALPDVDREVIAQAEDRLPKRPGSGRGTCGSWAAGSST